MKLLPHTLMEDMVAPYDVFITGGTGSLGKVLIRRLLAEENVGNIAVFSRDEAKQDHMRRVEFAGETRISYFIGDVRDRSRIDEAIGDFWPDIVVNTAALKQVPSCEVNPYEAYRTNIEGAHNVIAACQKRAIQTVIGISTDKATAAANCMGGTKFLQERLFIAANKPSSPQRFMIAKYGNVLSSKGSVIPFFHERILRGQSLPVTGKRMTRFLLSLDQAVDTIFAAITFGEHGEIFIPKAPSANIWEMAEVLSENNHGNVAVEEMPIRPGEKIHEVLISQEESARLRRIQEWHAVMPSIFSSRHSPIEIPDFFQNSEYSSASCVMTKQSLKALLDRYGLLHVEPGYR